MKIQKKDMKVVVPAGVDNGQRIKIPDEGEMGYRGSQPGDLYVVINVRAHDFFQRQGYEIISEIPISFHQAALGTQIETDTVDGKVEMSIPPGIQFGKMLRLKGKGVPYLDSAKRGDHLVIVRVVTPTKLSKHEKELFKKLAEERGESVNIDKSLWRRIKENF